jgi:hypothetical protein
MAKGHAVTMSLGVALASCGSFGATPDGTGDAGTSDTGVSGGGGGLQRRLRIANTGANELARGHVVCASIAAGDAGEDLAALRFVGPDGEIERFAEPRGASLVVCARLSRPIAAGTTDETYAIRYRGTSSPPAPGDVSKVFDLYDAFDGTALDPRWVASGSLKFENGSLVLPKGASAAVHTTVGTDGDMLLELRVQVQDPTTTTSTSAKGHRYWFGFQGGFEEYAPWTLFISRNAGSIRAEHASDSACPPPDNCRSPTRPHDSAFHVYRIERRLGGEARFFVDEEPAPMFTASHSTDQTGIILRNYLGDSDLLVDWIRGRRLARPEPTVTVGNEEPAP